MFTKSHVFVAAALFAALAVSGAANAAPANQGPGFEKCFAISLERGAGPDKGGGTREHSQHKAFMDQCLEGKIPMDVANPTALNVPANAQASSTASLKRSRAAQRAH